MSMSSFAPLGDDSDSTPSSSSASSSAASSAASSTASTASFAASSSLAPLNPHLLSSTLHQQIDRSFNLEKDGGELRISVDGGQRPLSLRLISGKAEIFGMDLLNDKDYTLVDAHTQLSVFSWYGAQVKVSGDIKKVEVIPATEAQSMRAILNAHTALEEMRKNAIRRMQQGEKEASGPRVLIVGPMDSGKSTLAKVLINYAVRAGHKPLFVDLDCGQNSISVAGAIAATSIEQPIGLETLSNNSSDFLHIKAPLAFFTGQTSPSLGVDYYLRLCERMAKAVERRCLANESSRMSGVVINTCGWVEGNAYDMIIDIANSFSIDVLFVLSPDDTLFNSLKAETRLQSKPVVSRLPRSPAIVVRDANSRRSARMRSIRFYFHGPLSSLVLHPSSRTLSFRDCEIYRVTGMIGAKEAAAAIAAKQEQHLQPEKANTSEGAKKAATALSSISSKRFERSKVLRVTNITQEMQHSIMAVMYPQEPAEMAESSVAGFVHIQAIDLQKKTIQLLTPMPGPLPSKLFLQGSVKWFD